MVTGGRDGRWDFRAAVLSGSGAAAVVCCCLLLFVVVVASNVFSSTGTF